MPLFPKWSRGDARSAAKRVFDLGAAVAALVISSPVLATAGVAIRMQMGSPVIFRQVRPGYRGEPFDLLKFRTMREPLDDEVWFRSDEARLTRLGRFLRRLSIDELPSLWNVCRGDMSLVGPRPLLPEYLPKYTSTEMRRHEVPPGITGWAQANGRQSIPFSKRLELDVWYVDHQSLLLDARILGLTLIGVFSGSGVHSGQAVDEVDDIGLSADVTRRPMNWNGGST